MTAAAFALSTPAPETLAVSGALTFATASEALSSVRGALDQGRQSRLDLGGLTTSDSAGLATVLAVLAHSRTQGRVLTVENIPAGMHALARVSGVDSFL
ncbi:MULTISPECIES: STAS domain-containing protein [unclassified Luteibacter]|uniref:STAS domain-containing protein n=1 Tax=unclassified Luteibacter TaxID=2620188 RepID=UPI0008C1F55E|nr:MULTISPECIES: STAS domain-containing protein [unclassified Luteibacter]MDR6937129.1 phospholipid transport system transporter-binding protein [Luteibacter sp. 3190]SEO45268.1 phospholipid transport system transporter-binding protein [Luteibacter sp. UNC138MFCol5.1]